MYARPPQHKRLSYRVTRSKKIKKAKFWQKTVSKRAKSLKMKKGQILKFHYIVSFFPKQALKCTIFLNIQKGQMAEPFNF